MGRKRNLWLLTVVVASLFPLSVACRGAVQSGPALAPEEAPRESEPAPRATTQPSPQDPEEIEVELRRAGISTSGWKTDFRIRSVPFAEIMSGGPPKDGIPAIDSPTFNSVAEANGWLDDSDPVQVVDVNGEVRAYPLQILIWHEIVNDKVGGIPVAATYCPLCNTALAFDATLPDGRVLDFGTTGKLRFSDLVMYDRQTESWWQQITGEAIIGELTGTQLEFIPSPIVSWAEFRQAHPDGQVLSRNTGFSRPYGQNPYPGYDTGRPFLFRGPEDDRLRATERVATVSIGAVDVAFPFSILEEESVVHYMASGRDIVVFYKKGTASALDSSTIARGRDVGATGVFIPEAKGLKLTFRADGDLFKDNETGTTWNLLGQAIVGALEGERLRPVVHGNHFWFSWAVFKPDTIIYRGRQ